MTLPAWVRRALDWLLTTDPHQRLRLTMTSLATALMLLCVLLFNALAWAGLARRDWMAWWTVAAVGGMFGVALFIRSGRALRLKDPSLTQFQLRYALVCTAWLYLIAGQARPLTPAILALIMTFGIFGMSSRQTALTAALGAPLFVAAWWWGERIDPPGPSGRLMALDVGSGVLIGVVLAGIAVLSVRLQRMRERLSEQKLALAQALEQIRHLAAHDDLTGLPNRRRMGEILEFELRRARRQQQRPLHLAVLDLDHFKRINDTHGHATGDAVLQAFAQAVQAEIREDDVLARWGGEEFVLLIGGASAEDARALLERVRATVATLAIAQPQGMLHITVSAGLAQHRSGETVDQTLERADQALYAAKAAGRNRVHCAPEAAGEVDAAG